MTSMGEQWGLRWHALQRDLASEVVLRWPERSMLSVFGGRDGSWLARAWDTRPAFNDAYRSSP